MPDAVVNTMNQSLLHQAADRFERAQAEFRAASEHLSNTIKAMTPKEAPVIYLPTYPKRGRRTWEEAEKLAELVRRTHAAAPTMSRSRLAEELGIDRNLVRYYLSDQCKAFNRVNAA
jgi:hypothetical protein